MKITTSNSVKEPFGSIKKKHVLFGKIKSHNICHTGTGGRAGTPSLTINKIKNKKNTHKTHLKKRCGGVRRQKKSLIILSFHLVSQKIIQTSTR